MSVPLRNCRIPSCHYKDWGGDGSERVGGVVSRLRGVCINRLGKSIHYGLECLYSFSSEAELCGSTDTREGCLWCGQLSWTSVGMSARGSFANWVQ